MMQVWCFPDQCVPDQKFWDVAPLVLFVPWINHPCPMCPVPGPHEGTGTLQLVTLRYTLATGHFALFAFLIGWCPSVRCKIGPHIITPSYRFSSLATLLSSKYFLEWFGGQGHDSLSKGRNIQEFSVGDTSVGDELTLHPTYALDIHVARPCLIHTGILLFSILWL